MKNLFLTKTRWLVTIILLTALGSGNAWGANKTFTKITSTSELTSGAKYLIVGESKNDILDGSNVGQNNVHAVTISSSSITCDESYAFTITGSTGNWTITGSDGTSSIGHTGSSNTLNIGSYTNTITFNATTKEAVIGCNSRTLRRNSSSTTYRYYTSGQSAVYLYKLAQTCTLSSIALTTTNVQKTFCVGETFNSTGLVTTASYTGGCSNATVTPASVSVPSGAMNSAGSKTVTVSYTEGGVTKTATYTITVQAKYTVTWMVNGSSYSTGNPDTQVCPGSHVTNLPTAPSPGSYCGQVFAGWTTAEYSGNSEPTPLYKTASEFPDATGNQTFYAVFADYAN